MQDGVRVAASFESQAIRGVEGEGGLGNLFATWAEVAKPLDPIPAHAVTRPSQRPPCPISRAPPLPMGSKGAGGALARIIRPPVTFGAS